MVYVLMGLSSYTPCGSCCLLSRLYKEAENPLMQSPDVGWLQTMMKASVTLYILDEWKATLLSFLVVSTVSIFSKWQTDLILYISTSKKNWHVLNISCQLSQEVKFITDFNDYGLWVKPPKIQCLGKFEYHIIHINN